MITGSQNVRAPVADMLNTASEPWPICQNQVARPITAPRLIRFRTTAFSGSRSERKVRISSRKVMNAIKAMT